MSDPYGHKPSMISEANQWHEMSFQISIDQAVDWDKVDLKKWAQAVARYSALVMAKSTLGDVEGKDPELIKTLIMAIKVDRISFVTDNDLHNLIDEFDGGDE